MGGLQFLLLINYNSMVHKKILLLLCFCSHQVLAADCGSVSGTTTISTNCTSLNIIGDDSNVTINSGVTINATKSIAVKTPNATNATITNNGTITVPNNDALRNTSPGHISNLTNNGSIAAGVNNGVKNGGVLDILTNTGTISAGADVAIRNLGGSARRMGTLTNSGTISAGDDFGIRNDGILETIMNSGTISADDDNGFWTKDTITTLTNTASGTISAGDDNAIKVFAGSEVETITNAGTISAGRDFGIRNDRSTSLASKITTLTNSGTISAANESGIWNDGEIVTLTNTGTIKAINEDYGIKNVDTGEIGLLNNSGTISAGNNYGIYNDGGAEITSLRNTGTISAAGNGISIFNDDDSIIGTLSNLQGASSSALTYDGKLPTNYNVIVNSTSDYGKTVFSSVSGTTTFGVDSTSTLESDTTYSSVISGLTNSDIAAGTSGSQVSGSTRKEWTLTNSSGNLWDLVVAPEEDITEDTITSVTTVVKPNVILGINNLTSVTEVNFANMNTYDCDLFDKNNICLSLGGRYTSINTPKTETNSAVLVGGYKLSDTLRVGAFYHSNLSHKTPASFRLSDKTPMTGVLLVWNQNPNHLGYQLKLANAYQQKNATLTREVVGSSEEGKGETVIEAKSYVAELQYGYQYGDNTVLRPYFAARSAVIKQDAYTETGISSPLTFNEIKDKSTTVLLGLKFNTNLTHKLSLKGSVGVEHDIEHSIDKLAPTGISGLSTVSLTESFNETRPVVSLGLDYALKSNHRLSGVLQYQELPYQSKTESNAYLYYTFSF
jgi:hypothetical protein